MSGQATRASTGPVIADATPMGRLARYLMVALALKPQRIRPEIANRTGTWTGGREPGVPAGREGWHRVRTAHAGR